MYISGSFCYAKNIFSMLPNLKRLSMTRINNYHRQHIEYLINYELKQLQLFALTEDVHVSGKPTTQSYPPEFINKTLLVHQQTFFSQPNEDISRMVSPFLDAEIDGEILINATLYEAFSDEFLVELIKEREFNVNYA